VNELASTLTNKLQNYIELDDIEFFHIPANAKLICKDTRNQIVKVRTLISYSINPSSDDLQHMIQYLRDLKLIVLDLNREYKDETYCAHLYHSGLCNVVYTKNTDILVFGCGRVITDISISKNDPHVIYYD
jgi:XPG I-region